MIIQTYHSAYPTKSASHGFLIAFLAQMAYKEYKGVNHEDNITTYFGRAGRNHN